MECSPRTASIAMQHLEQRLRNLQTTRVHDPSTLHDLESLLAECANQSARLVSSSDSTLVALTLPSLLHAVICLSKICAEKSDMIVPGPYLPREKLVALINSVKSTYNQIKEFIKSPALNSLIARSTEQQHFCEQLRLVTDAIADSDMLMTLISQKLIVKLITGGDDQQQSQQASQCRMDDGNSGLAVAMYGSVLQRMATVCVTNIRDKAESNRDLGTIKMYSIYFQMLQRLIKFGDTITQIESYTDFFRTMIQLHQCLETTCQQSRFQLEVFSNSVLLQDILQHFIAYALSNSAKLFFDELSAEVSSSKTKYASLILLFRVIEALDVTLTKQSCDLAIHLINLLVSHLFDLIDQCRVQLIVPAVLPESFSKAQVLYCSLYDITYSLLTRLFQHEPMQAALSAMTQLLQASEENISITSTSVQLASELIIQAWFLHHTSTQFQSLFGLFLAELVRLDVHPSLINQLLTMPHIRPAKFHAYDALTAADTLHRICDLHANSHSREATTTANTLPLIFPNNIDHLYPFVRLFQSELNAQQIQHAIDSSMYAIQQFLSLPVVTESTSRTFLLTLRLLTCLPATNTSETFKCLLGQLTQIFVLLDEQAASDVRLELVRVFAVHSSSLDDNDLGRLLDLILTTSVDPNVHSIAFHLGCLDIVDSLRQRASRSASITDLLIQLIVRYGNEHQCSHILKAHLLRVFSAYITHGNDDSLPVRVKSQCLLLRANIDEFERSKTALDTVNDRPLDENILKALDSARATTRHDRSATDLDAQLKFYRTLVDELELQQCNISTPMQQD